MRAAFQQGLLKLWRRMPCGSRALLKIWQLKLSTPAVFGDNSEWGGAVSGWQLGRPSDHIVVLPIIDWEFRIQRPQHLARQLRLLGYPVTYVRKDFWVGKGLVPANLGDGISGLFLPGEKGLNIYSSNPSLKSVSDWVRLFESQFGSVRNGRRVCLVHWPFWTELALALQEELGWTVVFDCFDDHGWFSGIPAEFSALEERLIKAADLLVVSSEPLRQKWRPLSGNCRILRNGVDPTHFFKTERPRSRPGKGRRVRIGYVGAISEWFAAGTVRGMAAARPDWDFVLAGLPTHPEIGALSGMGNVALLGEVPYSRVPELVSSFDIGIIPFEKNPLTWATNPVKMYEYLASGLPVVATGIPEVSRMGRLVYPAEGTAEFIAQAERALGENTPEMVKMRRAFACRHSWQRAGARLASWIEECFAH